MRHANVEPIFENRFDAGRQLALHLHEFAGTGAIVLGIPNGGMAVALAVALPLKADLDLVISRKIPLPLSPEGGFGSITDDGTMILNEDLVKQTGLTQQQIDYQVGQVRQDIRGRSLLYRRDKRPLAVAGRTVILVDDGLASGYTMRAAIASVKNRKPQKVVVAVPVGPESVVEELHRLADKVVTCAIGSEGVFYVSDYYRSWYDVSDEDVLAYLKEWRMRRYDTNMDAPPKREF
jgi:putative phosphoribosyl transferase